MRPTRHSANWLATLGLVLASGTLAPDAAAGDEGGAAETPVLRMGSRRELFVDHFLIDTMTGARLKLHEPQFAGIVFRFDKPWEGRYCGYVSVVRHAGGAGPRPPAREDPSGTKAGRVIYRMYYNSDGGVCVAESADGIRWVRPAFDDAPFKDKKTGKTWKTNRIVWPFIKGQQGRLAPFIDTKPGVPPSARYKAFAFRGAWTRPHLMSSGDGLHWKLLRDKPADIKGAFDSHNVGFYSEHEGCYVFYFRTGPGRWVSRSTSRDFLTWTAPTVMGAAPAERWKDLNDFARKKWITGDIYTNATTPYFRAPHVYVALASRFMAGRSALTAEQRKASGVADAYAKASGFNETVLLTSRGGNRYDRTFLEAFIRPGLGLKAWTTRSHYAAWGIVPTPDSDTHLSLYVAKELGYGSNHLARYTLRYDGFISVNAPYAWDRDGYGRPKPAELLTKPFTFSGKRLLINYSTSAIGRLRVEIQDAGGKSIEGRTLSDCEVIVGDEIEREVAWKGRSDLSDLAGKPVRLRFTMSDADLFSLRFGDGRQ